MNVTIKNGTSRRVCPAARSTTNKSVLSVLVAVSILAAMFVLVDDNGSMGVGIALENLAHTILDCLDRVFIVLDDHHNLGCNATSKGGVRHQHNGRGVDDNQVVLLFELFNQFKVMLGAQQFRRICRDIATGQNEEVFYFGRRNHPDEQTPPAPLRRTGREGNALARTF